MSGMEMLLAGGTGLVAYGNIVQGQAQQKGHDYNATMLRQNAAIEEQQGGAREEAQRRKAREVLGSQAAAFAQAGTGVGGSAADIMKQSATNAELDALMIRYESGLKATGLKNEAQAETYAGKVAKQAGKYGAIGSILGGGSTYLGLT
jgi:hypothetical protein